MSCASTLMGALSAGPPASILEGLAKARHPSAKAAAKASTEAAKAATRTPASQKESKKRSCGTTRPASMRTSGEESASLHKSASILASLRNGPSKKQRSLKEPRALPLRPISTCKRYCEAARAQSPARHGRLKPTKGFSSRRCQDIKEPFAARAGHTSSARPRLA